jgi:hypothetical protein
VLHHDGRWTHDGVPVINRRLRAAFDRGVAYLPDEEKFVVRLRHFRGEIEVEEAGFFVREFEPGTGTVRLSDGTRETLDPGSLTTSSRDGALLCRVKRHLAPGGLLARFDHAAHADLLHAVEETADGGFRLRVDGELRPVPAL